MTKADSWYESQFNTLPITTRHVLQQLTKEMIEIENSQSDRSSHGETTMRGGHATVLDSSTACENEDYWMWQYNLEMPASHNEESSPEAKHVHKLSFLGQHMYNSSQFITCNLVDSKSRTHYPYHYPIHSRCNTPTETPSHHQKHPIVRSTEKQSKEARWKLIQANPTLFQPQENDRHHNNKHV